ncbi:MAG: hypothetical protein IJD43_01970 [Thermoguttaceae bacterium]|nr:hypothetical protein [Thermoguttaceae bacterium]
MENEIILDDSFYHKSEEEQKEIHEEIRQMYLRRFSSIVDESMTYEEMHNKVSEYYQSVLDNKETIF